MRLGILPRPRSGAYRRSTAANRAPLLSSDLQSERQIYEEDCEKDADPCPNREIAYQQRLATTTTTTTTTTGTDKSEKQNITQGSDSSGNNVSANGTTSEQLQVSPAEERHLDQLVHFIDTGMTGMFVEKSPEEEVMIDSADAPITASDYPRTEKERHSCHSPKNDGYMYVAGDRILAKAEKQMDDFYDDVCAFMVDEVSIAISVAISGILPNATIEHNEESPVLESGGSMESVEHEEEQIKTNVIAEDADMFFFITEIDGTQGIHHDSYGNTEILLLEPSRDPFQLSYFSGNTELILVQKKDRYKFFNKLFNDKSIGKRFVHSRSARSTSSLPWTLPPPLVEDLSTCSETSDDRSIVSETSEEVQVTFKCFLLDVSEMTRQIISPVSKDLTDIVVQVNRDAYDGLTSLCIDAMNPPIVPSATLPSGNDGAVDPPKGVSVTFPPSESTKKTGKSPQRAIHLVASDITDASVYSTDLFPRD